VSRGWVLYTHLTVNDSAARSGWAVEKGDPAILVTGLFSLQLKLDKRTSMSCDPVLHSFLHTWFSSPSHNFLTYAIRACRIPLQSIILDEF